MAQILDPLPSDQTNSIVCCYVNATSQIQIARICNIANWYFERVVFPGQRLVFEAISEAVLEIHTGMMASAILSDKIPCDRLSIGEKPTSPAEVLVPDHASTLEAEVPTIPMPPKRREPAEPLTTAVIH